MSEAFLGSLEGGECGPRTEVRKRRDYSNIQDRNQYHGTIAFRIPNFRTSLIDKTLQTPPGLYICFYSTA